MILRHTLLIALASTAVAEKPPTFTHDVAPIIFSNCVACHHPGGIGPFSLTDYREVKKRAKLIARLTASRTMPPWLPAPGHGEFQGERRLTESQIATLDRWSKAGAPQGPAAELKAKPQWNDDWQLGKPDLILTLPEPFTLPAAGRDVYRNFILTNPLPADRYIRAVEIRPGTPRAAHHAFLFLDTTDSSRTLDAADPEPGYPGMNAGAAGPDGHCISWQPGKRALPEPAGTAWLLRQRTDIILQLHLRPTGKPEPIQPTIALYFSKKPPERDLYTLFLRSTAIDIPAGARDYAIQSTYTLPVDADLLAIWPHLHYLGDQVHGWAELPDGTTKELLLIPHWDFNWQGDYRFTTPQPLPKGTRLHMRATYDNSASNPRNPHTPPQRVRYGPETSDEMGELWFQFLPHNPADLALLRRDYAEKYALSDNLAYARAMIERDPKDASSRTTLGTALTVMGRLDEAEKELLQAVRDNPALASAHYVLSSIYTTRNDVPRAKAALLRTVELEPKNSAARNDLGNVLLYEGDIPAAITQLEESLRLNPADTLAQSNLRKAKARLPAPK